jgi:hypothetical protein
MQLWFLLPGPCFRRFARSDIVRTEVAVLKYVVPRSVTKKLGLLMLLGDSPTRSYDYQQMQILLSSYFAEQMLPSTTTRPVPQDYTLSFWLWTQGTVAANTSCAIARLNQARTWYRKLYRSATLNHPPSCILDTAKYALPQCAPTHQLDGLLRINSMVMSHNLTFCSSISAFQGCKDNTLQISCESEDGIQYAVLDQVWCMTIQSKRKEDQRTKQEKRALKEDEEKEISFSVKVQL